MEEELESVKAYTYNLENGKVVETKLDVKSGVFKDKISKNLVVKKFTFPISKKALSLNLSTRSSRISFSTCSHGNSRASIPALE